MGTTTFKANFITRGLFAAALVTCALVMAAPAAEAQPKGKRHPAIEDFEKQGGAVEYLGNYEGLDGWVLVAPEGNVKTVYVTPEGTLVMGILVDQSGQNQTAKQLVAYKKRLEGGQEATPGAESASAGASKAEAVYAEVEKAGWVGAGVEGAPYLYMFINVNCEHCQKFWSDLQGPIKSGKLQVRLVPFGAVEANREGGAALLSVDDPATAWQAYINGDKGALSKDKIKPGALEKVDANTKLFGARKMKGPPFTLYRKPSDGVVTGIVGRPDNAMIVLSDLMGMP